MKPLPLARRLALALTAAAVLGAGAAHAGPFGFGSHRQTATPAQHAAIDDIQRALDEGRLMDAGVMIDQATAAGIKDPQLHVMSGELGLRRGANDLSIRDFKAAQASPETKAQGLQGEGIALARMGRQEDAIATLRRAVEASPGAWRAWNALGSMYDGRMDWKAADDAYAHALEASNSSPLVLNNRGWSRLLRGQVNEASEDFVAALQKKPDLAEARTNLRLALALKGDYARALAGAGEDDRAALLNNAGFAAAVRGDYAGAEDLLQQALKAHGEFYDRASQNLKVIHGLQAEATPQHARN